MSFDQLLTLKKVENNQHQQVYHRHLIVGEDIYTIACFLKLHNRSENVDVKIVSSKPFSKDSFRLLGPSTLRGEHNAKVFSQLFPNVEIRKSEKQSVFYKEQKFKEFSGRAKPEKLLYNEPYFIDEYYEFDCNAVFDFLANKEEILELLNEARLDVEIMDVEKSEVQNLANNEQWIVGLSDGRKCLCENLYWGQAPYQFLQNYKNKSELSDKFIELIESTHGPISLVIELSFDKVITDKTETLFLPLSYTHDWGHFVGEFKGQENGRQMASFLTFIDENHSNEESISKLIRLLKKNLEKIFEKISTVKCEEYIALGEGSTCLKIDDSVFQKLDDNLDNLLFVGESAVLRDCFNDSGSCEDSVMKVSHLVRGLASLSQAAILS